MPATWSDTYDPTRIQFAIKAPLVTIEPASKAAPTDVAKYLQNGLNRLGASPQLKVDGRPGPKTKAAIVNFQKGRGLPTTGVVDQQTWYHLDWLVYDGWTPAPSTTTSSQQGRAPGGPGILRGCNVLTGERVDKYGLTREARRGHDIVRHYVAGTGMGVGRAVYRLARNSENWSDHAKGAAIDPLTDADKDGRLEPHEYVMSDLVADTMVARAQGYPAVSHVRRLEDATEIVWTRGPDNLAIAVWTNHKMENGTRKFSSIFRLGKDWSWSAKRNTWKALSGTVHHNHCHLSFGPGAPT